MNELLAHSWFGNSLRAYAMALIVLATLWAALWILKTWILSRLKHWASQTATALDDFLIALIGKIVVPVLYVSAIFVAVHLLKLPPSATRALSILWSVILMVAGVRLVNQLLHHLVLDVWLKKKEGVSEAVQRQFRGLMPILSVGVWVVGLILLLDNLGFKITTFMAGLGIGGVAIALAAQAILGDLFSYFAIMLDRPFEIDDFIIAGDQMGTIERIGIKTTRVRSLSGEELIFSNKDLTDSRIRNFKRMQIRRIVFKLGLTYDTSLEKLKRAVALTREAIEKTAETRFDRCHFASYGDFNLVIEAVYFVLSADYNKYMDVQQAINFRIKESFEKEGLVFAFPTQTIHLAGRGPV